MQRFKDMLMGGCFGVLVGALAVLAVGALAARKIVQAYDDESDWR